MFPSRRVMGFALETPAHGGFCFVVGSPHPPPPKPRFKEKSHDLGGRGGGMQNVTEFTCRGPSPPHLASAEKLKKHLHAFLWFPIFFPDDKSQPFLLKSRRSEDEKGLGPTFPWARLPTRRGEGAVGKEKEKGESMPWAGISTVGRNADSGNPKAAAPFL